MLNNVKTGFCFLLFLIHFIFFHFKLLNFDFKSSHSSFYVTIVCLICVFLHKKKFQSASRFFAHAKMAVEYEGRSFTEDEERQLTRAIESAAGIEILCIIEKNTATEQVHKKMLDESLEAIHEKDGQFYKGTLRGRQVLESEQSIVIIGDIEEGATVASKGNVIVTVR